MRTVSFTVYGHPAPQGSSRAFIPKGWKRAIVTSTNPKLKPWRQEISGVLAALNEQPFDPHVPLACSLTFFFARPKTASLRKRPGMTTKPDGDKLMRAVWDAMKGVLIHDDSQIVTGRVRKLYGDPERVEVTITEDLQ